MSTFGNSSSLGQKVICFLDDPGPAELDLSCWYTTSAGAVYGSFVKRAPACVELYVTSTSLAEPNQLALRS